MVSTTGFDEVVEGNLPLSLLTFQLCDILYTVTVKNNSMQPFFCWVCFSGFMPEDLQPVVLVGKCTSLVTFWCKNYSFFRSGISCVIDIEVGKGIKDILTLTPDRCGQKASCPGCRLVRPCPMPWARLTAVGESSSGEPHAATWEAV